MKALLVLVLAFSAFAAEHRVAITIDDLPRGGDGGARTLPAMRAMTKKLLAPFREQHIPVIGFVNAGKDVQGGEKGVREILELWLDAGADLGNHAYSHPSLNELPLDQYTADIVKGEPLLREVLAKRGKKLVYYRHPFLQAGPTPEKKRGLEEFLDAHGYRVAPVTIDDSDYMYARLYTHPEYRDRVRREYVPYMESVTAFFEERAPEVTGHETPQILLIHASQMNADLMPELLAMFRRRGYGFISLDQALADPAYALPENFVGKGGFSWIHRWSMTKGMKGKGEPDPPKWVEDGFAAAMKAR